ncbi:acetate--CoA ligase family protein [Agrobacterium sp. a22-2]|uniref:acetate--CoA ligase family protein n=1 Tax=Agrobacterium sp. a22-2 TaxID=2283840 RepID=UPI001447A38E|nr:acetate--CoA ligase family protein [Agrobacterium sp. a22-2]NKN36149.1 acetate--CoA ligase family protein [Agrobacterium sp. a22-2]
MRHMPKDLSRLIRPTSIAVFGGKEARRVIEQCDKMGFAGAIWPVHPKLDEILGRKCYRTVADLPAAPDASFVGVNRMLTIEIIGALAGIGAGGAICYASGFSEAVKELPDGDELQARLVEAAGDMPVVGPNCYGFINMLDGALLWPDQHGMQRQNRGVAVLTQSSNIACNISMQQRGLPLAYLMTAGNQAQTGLSALALAALEDPRVTAVGLHIEGFDDLATLERLGSRARELKKPVIALKVGKSEAARKATVSHTASLAGNHKVSSAVLARFGIGQVETLPELLETLKLLHVAGPLMSNSISSMSCSGGEASLIADAGTGRRIHFRDLKDEQRQPLREILGEMVTISNPLDYHTFVWGNLDRQTAAFTTMMQGDYALNLVVLDFPRADRCDPLDWVTTVDAVIAAAQTTGANAGVVASMAENMPEVIAERLVAAGVTPFSGIDEALAAAEIAHGIHRAWAAPLPAPLLSSGLASGEAVTLSEYDSKRVLSPFGLPVPLGRFAEAPEDAAKAATAIGFPVALKGSGVAHKTEAGAVRLNLSSEAEVIAAARSMAAVADGYLVERMAAKPVAELILGALRDPVAGPVLTIGAGGILVELLDDSAVITLPTTKAEIERTIAGLKISTLLNGYRGQPKGDLAALVNAVSAAADFVTAHAAEIEELDINPLMVLPEGQGVVAVDALVRMRV